MSTTTKERTWSQIRADVLREAVAVLRDEGRESAAVLVEVRFGLRRECVQCGAEIPPTRRRHAKFCRSACSTAHSRKPWGPERAEYQRQWRAKRKAAASV